jgi:hypothetical protein
MSLFGFLTLEDGTNRLSRNVGMELPLYAANIRDRNIVMQKVIRQNLIEINWQNVQEGGVKTGR